ncbi:MAG: 7-cyano-7-deazaguanine synthase QueC [Candidatus Hodarchaeota archaeon]
MSFLKKLAITGANGYLGKHSIRNAIQNGWEVNAVVRRQEVVNELENLGAKVFIVQDFNIEGFKEAFKNCSVILHLANIVCGSKELFEKVNIKGLKSVIEAAKTEKLKKIIYPSGLGVDKYGLREWANNEYFRSKREAEQIIIESGINYTIFRPSYILGPNDELIPELIDQIFDGKVLIAGDGNVPMQPIFVKDATNAFLAAAEGKGNENSIYELIGPKVTKMNDLIEMVILAIKEKGINIPRPEILHISYKEAPEKLEICKEMVDVMRCDLTPDPNVTIQALGFELSPLQEAVNAAVNAKLFPRSLNIDKRAILLLSGGIDSATALFWALDQGYEVIALSLNYNWRPKQEAKAAAKLAEKTKINLIEIDTTFIAQAADLLSEGYPVPTAINAPEGYIPQRNIMYYSIAAYFAEIYGCKWIIGGHIFEDTLTFSDTNVSFFESLERLIRLSKHENNNIDIKILIPLAKLRKFEVLNLAKELKVPLELTWSCYNDFEEPCGRCQSCMRREDALKTFENLK